MTTAVAPAPLSSLFSPGLEFGMQDDSGGTTNVFFVETQQWEQQALVELCSRHCKVHADHRPIQDIPDSDLPGDVEIFSPFIQSRVDGRQLDRLGPHLRLISTRSTGYDHIDMPECDTRGIIIANVPVYGETSVAEHCFAILLALTRKVCRAADRTARGDFSIEGLRGADLHGKVFGAIGAGAIARRTLRMAGGFGMRRLAYDIHPDADVAGETGFEYVDFDDLLARSDVISLHVPYNRHTHHMIDAEALHRCKPGVIIVNTARGALIDTRALIDALRSGQVGGAALDVIEGEEIIGEEAQLLGSGHDIEALRHLLQSQTLLRMPNVIITPHIGFNSEQSVRRIIETTIQNIRSFIEGEPAHVVHIPLARA